MTIEQNKANEVLKKKRAELQAVNDKVENLTKEYVRCKQEKERLDMEIQRTKDRLERADQLNTGLADEQIRWKDTVEYLGESIELLLGNIFVAGASVTYYGPFTGVYR